MKHLSKEDLNVILESLKYSKKAFEEYTGYPSEQFRAERIVTVVKVINKVKEELKELND